MSEEAAIKKYGADNVEVYHAYYKPTEFFIPGRNMSHCYLKVIGLLPENERVIGMHFLGPQAGEVIQGFAAAVKLVLQIKFNSCPGEVVCTYF